MKTMCSFAGILARETESDLADMASQKFSHFQVIVCNLYPFVQTVSKPDCSLPVAVENIDIGKLFIYYTVDA